MLTLPAGITPYYQEDTIAIIHGDCREVLPALQQASVDLLLTDPPFSIPAKYHNVKGDFPKSWGDLMVLEPFFREVFAVIKGVMKSSGQVYVCCDAHSYPAFYKITLPFWAQSHLLIWYKPTGRRGTGWKHSYEMVLHLATKEAEYRPAFRQDVFGIMPVKTLNREHPVEKPGDLWRFLLEASPTPCPMLLDPFMGVGNVLRMAKDLGYPVLGIEIEERYCERAARRLQQEVLPLEPS